MELFIQNECKTDSTARDSRDYIIELKYHEKDVAASVPGGATSKL